MKNVKRYFKFNRALLIILYETVEPIALKTHIHVQLKALETRPVHILLRLQKRWEDDGTDTAPSRESEF